MDNYRDIINHALNRENRSYKRSGWAWLVFGLISQGVLVWLLSRAPRPIEPPYWFVFIVASAPFAWWPLIRGVKHLRRARQLKDTNGLLRRALTTQPQLIESITLGSHTSFVNHLVNAVFGLLSGAAHGVQHSASQFDFTSASNTESISHSRTAVTLTNGEKHLLTAFKDYKELIAAIRAHAPHAETSPVTKARQQSDQKPPESNQRAFARAALIGVGGLMVLGCSIVFMAQYMNAWTRAKYTKHGVITTAVVSELRSFKDDEKDESSKTYYIVEANFNTREGKHVSSRAELVEKSDYEKLKVGEAVEVYYLPEPPNYFALSESAKRYRNGYTPHPVFIAISLSGLLMLIVGIVMSRKKANRPIVTSVNAALALLLFSVLTTQI